MMMVVRVCVCDAARLGAKGDTFRRPARASFAWRNFAFFNFTYEGPLGPAIGRTSEVVAGGARTFFERVFDARPPEGVQRGQVRDYDLRVSVFALQARRHRDI